jgi:hypothetical protein
MSTLSYAVADSVTMLRRQLRHMQRYASMTVMLVGMPIVFLLLFVYVFGGTLGSGLGGAATGRAALDVRGQLLEEALLRHVADESLRLLAVLEQDHGRDRAHAVAARGDRVRVDVQLRDLQLLAALVRDLLEDGRDHPARTAPRGPEVDEHRLIGPDDLLLEGLVTDGDWLGHLLSTPFTS